MTRTRLLALLAALSLALLLALLLLVESTAQEATIVSVPAALWYLLTTLTTVGYGDCYPVTAAGRIIGAVFQLMSLGVLGLLIGALSAFLRGTAWQRLRLARLGGRKWYIFSEKNDASLALAQALKREDAARVLLFAGTKEDCDAGKGFPLPAAELCRRKKDGDFCLFCLSPDEAENERLADSVQNGQVYCRSGILPDRLPQNQQRFDAKELCARLYWDRFPLQSSSETVLIAGDGSYAEAILEQGLLRNVLAPCQHVTYICAGDWSGWQRQHPELEAILTIDEAAGGRDEWRVTPHWDSDPALLQAADRIVFCQEDEAETRRAVRALRRCFALSCKVHARLSEPIEGAVSFGAAEELYTPELVLREGQYRLARALHERYRAENPHSASWEALSDFTRRSNMAAADHLETKLRLLGQTPGADTTTHDALQRYRSADAALKQRLRKIEHARWCRFHLLNGWRWGQMRDNEKRLHPMLIHFDALSPEQQAKDDYSWELALSAKGGSYETKE